MTCDRVQSSLKACLDREVNPRDRAALSFHLSRCPHCRAEMEAIRMASHGFRSLSAPRSSDETRQAVFEAARTQRPSPLRTAGRRLRSWGLALGAAGALLVLALYLALRPSPAQAALARVADAVEAVRTQHTVMWMQPPGGPRETRASWYSEGKWRMEVRREGQLTELTVYDGEWSNGYNPATNTAYLRMSNQPFGTDFKGFSVAAMLESLGDADVKLEAVVGREGRRLNRFSVSHDVERFVILADTQTDLPVSFEFYARAASGWEKAGGSEKVEYNLPVDATLFEFTPPERATVVDNQKLKEEWQQRFDQGIARQTVAGREVVLRDFQVTAVGDVYVIWTEGTVDPHLAAEHYDSHLTDSLGTHYFHSYGFQAWGKPSGWFVPVEPPAGRPAWYELTVVTQKRDEVRFRITHPMLSASADPTYPTFKDKPGKSAFHFSWGVYAEIGRAQARAGYWKKQGEPRRALQYFEQATALADAKVHRTYLDRWTWQQMGELYEEIGERKKAREAYQRGLDSYECSSNRDIPPEKEAAARLRAAIARLR